MKLKQLKFSEHIRIISDQIPGGLADDLSDEMFDQKQIQMGIKVEMEHVGDSDMSEEQKIEMAKEIAKDHLVEDSKYYDKLLSIGL